MTIRRSRLLVTLSLAAPLALSGASDAAAHADRAGPSDSPYLAGYTSTLAGTGSIGRITVPAISCPQGADSRVAFGIADQGPEDAQPVVRAAVDVICDAEGGPAEYGTEVAVPGQLAVSGSVAVGDVLTFRITYRKDGQVVASVVDKSNARGSITLTGTSGQATLHFGALPIVEGEDQLIAAPDFGRITVVRAAVAGVPLTGRSSVRYQRVDAQQDTIVATRLVRRPPRAGSFSLVSKPG